MITTLTQYIFLLLFLNTLTYAKKVDITFEVFHAKNNYLDIARKKALKLNTEGFKCYIVKGKTNLSLRCNDSKSMKEMQKTINKMKKRNIDFVILNRNVGTDKREYKTLNQFYLGYAAFDRKEYKKALAIFKFNYEKEKSYEHAYAYALALMKTGQHKSAMNVLSAYRNDKKANKLYKDIASTYMYQALNRKNYKKAHEIVDKYRGSRKTLHKLINKQEVNDLIEKQEYKKAALLAKKYNLQRKIYDIDYSRALELVKRKNYKEANSILKPYIDTHKQAHNLFFSNIVAYASKPYAKKNYKEALDILEPYRKKSYKVQSLYNDILYNRALANGWTFLDKTPSSALISFKEACKIEPEYSCYNGMMYSYYNLEKYDKSLYLAKKLYNWKANDELSTLAMRSSLKMKNYESAKLWFERTKNKKGLTSPYLLETYLTIDDYIKVKDYTQALNMVEYLKSLYPQNIEVLKREMQLYIAQKKYDQAQGTAEKILYIDNDSVEAKYTLALYEFEHQDYEGCSQRLNTLKLSELYQKNLKNRCDAYSNAKNRDINGAVKAIEKIDDADIKAAFYFDIGDMYKSLHDVHALRAYQEGRKYKENIDTQMIYLYALKDFTKDERLDKELSKAYKRYPQNSNQLDEFRIAYEKDRLYGYYKNKRYSECYHYSNIIEEFQNDRDVYKMGGWCAYNLKKYEKAKEKFAYANLMYGESNEDIYAYALSSYQNGEKQRAVEALNRIALIETNKEAILIAGLYMDLQKQEKAREILMQLEKSESRDDMLVNINRSYTQNIFESSASAGMYYQSQTGLEGKSKFDKFVIPIDYDYYDTENNYHLYFDGDLMYLSNGYIQGNQNSILDFGLGTSTQDNPLSSDIGFMPKIGVNYKNISAQIGTTPLGAKISPELTWMLSAYIPIENWRLGLKVEQKEIDETMLSFVGERATDGTQEVNWGRVLKRGIEAQISYDSIISLSLSGAYYPQIFGLNVEDNSEKKVTGVAIYHPKVENLAYLDIGIILAFDAYEKNSNFFTYGKGGYFSPQQFFLGSLFTKFGDILSNDFYYQAKLGLGFQGFIVEDSLKFPLQDGIINSGDIQPGYRDGGIVYKGALQLGYKINKRFDFISGVSMERINGYELQQLTFALIYRFNSNRHPTLNSFGLNHRVNQIIK